MRAARRRMILAALAVPPTAYWALLSSRSQALGRFPYRGTTGEPVVALTFDDGPNEPFTSAIADFLADRGIAATFFQVGKCVERFPGTPPRLLAQGHVLGNHSYSHRVLACLAPMVQRQETERTQDVLAAITGRRPALYRPPWLLRTPWLFATLHRNGLQPVSGMFCSPWEVFQPAARRIAHRALAKVRPGRILIFHDGYNSRGANRAQTVEAVRMVVDGLTSRGYRFVTVDQLLQVPAYQK